jgi:hypothetical protein
MNVTIRSVNEPSVPFRNPLPMLRPGHQTRPGPVYIDTRICYGHWSDARNCGSGIQIRHGPWTDRPGRSLPPATARRNGTIDTAGAVER